MKSHKTALGTFFARPSLQSYYLSADRGMSQTLWLAIAELARQFEAEFPNKATLRKLAAELAAASSAESHWQEVEYLHLTLTELLDLAQRNKDLGARGS
jgi:hypothetical protein